MSAGATAARVAAPTLGPPFPLRVCGWPAPVPASASPLASLACGRPAAESAPVPPPGLLTCGWPAAAAAPPPLLAHIWPASGASSPQPLPARCGGPAFAPTSSPPPPAACSWPACPVVNKCVSSGGICWRPPAPRPRPRPLLRRPRLASVAGRAAAGRTPRPRWRPGCPSMGRSGAPVASACGVNSGGPDTAKPRFTDFGDTVISALVPTAPHGGRSGLPPPGMSEPLGSTTAITWKVATPRQRPPHSPSPWATARRLAGGSPEPAPTAFRPWPSVFRRDWRVYAAYMPG